MSAGKSTHNSTVFNLRRISPLRDQSSHDNPPERQIRHLEDKINKLESTNHKLTLDTLNSKQMLLNLQKAHIELQKAYSVLEKLDKASRLLLSEVITENYLLREELNSIQNKNTNSSNPIWQFLDQSGLDEAEILRLSYAFSPQELDALNGIVLKIFIEQGEDTKVLARHKKVAAKLISAAQTSNCSVSIFDSQECLSELRVDAVSDEFSHTIFIGKASTIASLMEEEIFFRAKRKLRFIQGEKINAVNLLRKLAARSIRQAKHASRQGE